MKTILITGGSDGLGKAIAKLLADKNNVVILSNNKLKLREVAQELKCRYEFCDVSDFHSVEKAVQNLIEKYKKIDVLINNAGVWLADDITENTYDQISYCIDVNTKGPIYLMEAVLPNMILNKEGLIVNVCSQASFDNDDLAPVYTASKWAMRGFNRSIQKSLSKKNIKVTGFYPGFMQTEIFKKAGNDYDTSTGLEVEKVAKAVEFILNCDKDVIIPEFGIKDIENY
jgi:NADP-dependent 3-hydroxy acid dehydrogenase YdfG